MIMVSVMVRVRVKVSVFWQCDDNALSKYECNIGNKFKPDAGKHKSCRMAIRDFLVARVEVPVRRLPSCLCGGTTKVRKVLVVSQQKLGLGRYLRAAKAHTYRLKASRTDAE